MAYSLGRVVKGDVIPDTDDIARFCRPKQVEGDEVLAAAFLPRSGEDYLSVNWVEYLGLATEEAKVGALRALYRDKFEVGAAARIAILPVGSMRNSVREKSPDHRVLTASHEPLGAPTPDPSHSGVFNVRHDDELIAELICQSITQSFPARE